MNGVRWLDQRGETLDYSTVIKRASAARVALLGERHDWAEHHRWQLHIAAALVGLRPITMGFEMFPVRANPILAEWVAGDLTEEEFLSRVDWASVWGFPAELYMPLFHFCRDMQIPMIGLNVKRDLVRSVGSSGWDGKSDDLKEGLTRPAASPMAYRRFIFDLTGGSRPDRKAKAPDDPVFDNFVAAQEIWDRVFATRLAVSVTQHPDRLAIGIMGKGHIQYGGGVPWQLHDLGITESLVAVPTDMDEPCDSHAADAIMLLRNP